MTLTRSPVSVYILEHIATCGVSSRKAVMGLPVSERTAYHKLTQLRREGYIIKAGYDNGTLYALTQKGKEALYSSSNLSLRSRLYYEHLCRRSQRVTGSDTVRTTRQKRQSEIATALINAGAQCLVGRKPMLSSDGIGYSMEGIRKSSVLKNTGSVYYSSNELRNVIGISSRFAASARMYGVLASGGNVYGVFHTGERAITASFNKEVLAYEEFCAALSVNGYLPNPNGKPLRTNGLGGMTCSGEVRRSPERTGPDELGMLDAVELKSSTGYSEAEPAGAVCCTERYEDDPAFYDHRGICPDHSQSEPTDAAFAPDNYNKDKRAGLNDETEVDVGTGQHKRSGAGGEAAAVGPEEVSTRRTAKQRRRIADLNLTADSSEAVQFVSAAMQERLADWLGHYYIDTIVFGEGFGAAFEMIEKAHSQYSILKPAPETFRSMCYVPMDGYSSVQIKLLLTPNRAELLKRIIFDSKPEKDEQSGCDGIVNGQLWYNFFDLDLIRIRELLDHLSVCEETSCIPQVVIWGQTRHEAFFKSLFDGYNAEYRLVKTEKLLGAIDKIIKLSGGSK